LKIPRNIHGRDLANHLIKRWEFLESRQTGSHINLRTEIPTGLSVSIPAHKPMKVGTLSNILNYVSQHKGVSVSDLLRNL
jgi:predicted RNA binding protein YcfA (HicA-like mRNA interferase family)